jgi:NAD(P)H dehydrogenase (quinone)
MKSPRHKKTHTVIVVTGATGQLGRLVTDELRLLRHHLYSEHFAPFVRQALQSGVFASSTRDSRVASASRRDLAAAAAAVITEAGHEGRTYELSGDAARDNVDLVQALSAISGGRLEAADMTLSTLIGRPSASLEEMLTAASDATEHQRVVAG